MDMRFTCNSDQVDIYRVKTLRGFERIIRDLLEHREKPYRLFISYKNRHRVKRMAGRLFMWNETEEARNGIDVESDEQGFGEPRFDGVWAALFITDECVVAFGDARLIAEKEISGEHVVCNAYVCDRFVSKLRIPAEVFDHFFGLKENFPEQYENVFGKTEDAKPVQEKNDLVEEAKRNIESCRNLLNANECQLERAMDAIKLALMDISDQKCELGDMLAKLDDTPRKLKQGFELSGNSE